MFQYLHSGQYWLKIAQQVEILGFKSLPDTLGTSHSAVAIRTITFLQNITIMKTFVAFLFLSFAMVAVSALDKEEETAAGHYYLPENKSVFTNNCSSFRPRLLRRQQLQQQPQPGLPLHHRHQPAHRQPDRNLCLNSKLFLIAFFYLPNKAIDIANNLPATGRTAGQVCTLNTQCASGTCLAIFPNLPSNLLAAIFGQV